MHSTTFTLELDSFKGPLELLLELIEQQKLKVNDVALAQVSDDYIRYIQDRDRVPLSQTAQFVVVASTLLLIKSRSLLPTLVLTDDEKDDIRDLEHRLQQYAHVRRAARILHTRWRKYAFNPAHTPPRSVAFAPAPDITPQTLHTNVQRALASLVSFVQTPTARVAKELRLEDVVSNLSKRIQRLGRESFSQLTSGAQRVEAIVHFLALLELVKAGSLEVTQSGAFSDILLEYDDVALPHYD